MRRQSRSHDHMRYRIISHVKKGNSIHTKSRNNVKQEYNSLIEEEERSLPFALNGQRVYLEYVVVAECEDDPRYTANCRSHKEKDHPDSAPSDFRKIRILASSFKPISCNKIDTLLIIIGITMAEPNPPMTLLVGEKAPYASQYFQNRLK